LQGASQYRLLELGLDGVPSARHYAADPMVVRTRVLFPGRWAIPVPEERTTVPGPVHEPASGPAALVGLAMAMARPDRASATKGTILCGLDDSQSARDALQLAAALSERLHVRLVVAHVASRKSGEGAERLAQIAAEEGPDLSVVGLGRGSRLPVRAGSTLASELESTTACPVVIAPPQTRPRSQLRLARAGRDTAS
jgi:hypothetical protein